MAHPDALREFAEKIGEAMKEAEAAGEDPRLAANRIIPRLAYMGHRVIRTYQHPDKRAEWECYSCQHRWVSTNGTRCPSCLDCQHVWQTHDGLKTCEECGLPYEE